MHDLLVGTSGWRAKTLKYRQEEPGVNTEAVSSFVALIFLKKPGRLASPAYYLLYGAGLDGEGVLRFYILVYLDEALARADFERPPDVGRIDVLGWLSEALFDAGPQVRQGIETEVNVPPSVIEILQERYSL